MDIQRGNLLIYGFFASNILDQGIPVEYELDTFNMPSTSTTEIYYVDSSATPLSTSSHFTSGHINGDNAYSSQTPDTRSYTVALNTSLTRPTTRCHFQHPAKLSRLQKTHKPKYHEFCSAKNKPPQKLQIKTFVIVCCYKTKSCNSFLVPKI